MKIKIVTRDRTKDNSVKEAIKEYEKRLARYCKVELKTTRNILKGTKDKAYVIRVCKTGDPISSEELAEKISSLAISGNSNIYIILDDECEVEKTDYVLCVSNMDIHRDLMLIIIYEQIYRAFRIINNEPYHK